MRTQTLKYLAVAYSPEDETGTALTVETGFDGGDDAADVRADVAGGDDALVEGLFDIAAPEEFEAYSDDFKAFSSDMNAWIENRPEASVKDALQEAARRQADLVHKQEIAAAEAWQKTTDGWLKEARSDPDIGGDDFMKNAAIGRRALDTFGDDELKDILNQSGLGNHRAVIKFFAKAGRQLAESGVPKPGETGKGQTHNERLTEALYGSDR
ncbi:MAG: hypothetical protein AAGE61_18420 [Pseudomonadota bacterium]